MTSHSRLNAVMGDLMSMASSAAVLERVTTLLERRFANVPTYTVCRDDVPTHTTFTADELMAAHLTNTLPIDFGRGREWCEEVLTLMPIFQLGLSAQALVEALTDTAVS